MESTAPQRDPDESPAVSTAVRGTGWSMGSALATRGLSWVVTLGVARAFSPAQFGLIAVCWTVHNAAVLLRDQAVTSTIVVANEDRTLRSTMFALTVGISLVVGAVIVVLGRPVSSLLGLDAVPLMALFAGAFVASALGTVHGGLLQRALRFRAMAAVELTAALTYVAVTLALIFADVGPTAVGWGQLAGASVGTVGVWLSSGFTPTTSVSLRAFRRVARYSAGTVAIAALSFAFANIDTLWVAARTDADDVGHYSLAFNVAFVFAMTLAQVVQRVAFSTHAAYEGDPVAGRRLLIDSERLVLAVALPAATGLIVFGPFLIDQVFGARYEGAAGPVRVLAAYGLLSSIAAPASSFLRARGRLRVVVRALIVQLLLGAAGLAATVGAWGITGAAVSVSVALAIGTGIILHAAFDLGRVSWRDAHEMLPGRVATAALIVPLSLVIARGESTWTIVTAGSGLAVYSAITVLRERRRLPLRHADPGVGHRRRQVVIVTVGLLAAVVAGGAVTAAPLLVAVAFIGAALVWIASSNMTAATLVVLALAPLLPIGLFVDVGPALPLVTAGRALIGLVVLGGLLAVARGKLRVVRWVAWPAFGLWLLAVAASVPGSIDVPASRLRLMSEIFETAAFAGVVFCVLDRSTYRRALHVLVGGAAVGGALAVLQLLHVDVLAGVRARAASVTDRGNALVDDGDVRLGFARAQGAFQTPSFLGAGMALALPVSYALAVTERHLRRRWVACTGLIAAGLIASVTRAAWLAAAGATLIVIVTAARRAYPTVRHLYVGAVLAVGGAIVLPSALTKVAGLLGEVVDTRADATTSTTNYRLFLHEQVLDVVRDRPLTGWGAGTFDRIGISGVNRGLVVKLTSADSHLLRLLAEVGVLGTVAFAVLLVTVLTSLARERRTDAAADCVLRTAVLAAGAGYILVNLTISAFTIAQPTTLFWGLIAAGCAAARVGPARPRDPALDDTDRVVLVPA